MSKRSEINLNHLKKTEILWLWNHRCRHGQRYIHHPHCFHVERNGYTDEECPVRHEKTGFLDIESTGLKANWDFVISYCIKQLDGKMYEALITPKEIKNYIFDHNILRQLCIDIKKFDRIVVYWGKDRRHDLPFLRTRALKWKLNFPLYKEIFVTDAYDMAKSKLSLHSYRLDVVCQFFGIPAKGHKLDPERWQKAQAGCRKSLKWILEHNREDVISLEEAWKKLVPFFRGSKTSI